jgi:peptidoglycan L-alanyl-D-glutamate endopeptidase CwlK
MINSRDTADLLPSVKFKADAFLMACQLAGITVVITSTYRDAESQDRLYAQGRTTPGKIVTKAKGGESFHQFRVAFDFVPVVNGKAVWDDEKLWQRCGEIGRKCSLEWGGGWGFKDKPHMQSTGGYSIEDYKEGKGLKE